MMRPKLAVLASFLVAAVASWGGLTMGQSAEERPPGKLVADADVAIATVVAIDHKTRRATLRNESGDELTFTVGPDVRNLEQVKRGDQVLMQYYEGLAVALAPKGSGIRERTDRFSIARETKPGEKPAAEFAHTVDAVGTVQAVDQKTRKVTIQGTQGTVVELKVADDVDLSKVKVGDQVEASYIESLAISVVPAPKVSGKVDIESRAVALGVGVEWGHGTLTMYDGSTHKFKIGGLSVVDVGISKVSASGEVYQLVAPKDLEGVYVSGEAGVALGGGRSEVVMKNNKGVVMRLKSKQKGVKLTLAPEGLRVTEVQ